MQLSQFSLHVKFQRILESHNSARMRMSQHTKLSADSRYLLAVALKSLSLTILYHSNTRK